MHFVLRFKEGDVDFSKTKIGENGTDRAYIHIALNSKTVEYARGILSYFR